jgi:methionine sulfoxide reductase heme-binding subunit
MKQLSPAAVARIKALLFLLCLIPFGQLVGAAWQRNLGPDPVETITHGTGLWSLRLLLVTLAISPLRHWTGWLWLVRLRRTLALYAFFYATLHVAIYLVFEQAFDWPEIVKDVVKRPHLTAGFLSFVLMVPLVATSTNAMMKRLGTRRWQLLHRLTYPVAATAVLHYFWLVKRDVTDPTLYALALSFLLCVRLVSRPRKVRTPPPLTTHHPYSSG